VVYNQRRPNNYTTTTAVNSSPLHGRSAATLDTPPESPSCTGAGYGQSSNGGGLGGSMEPLGHRSISGSTTSLTQNTVRMGVRSVQRKIQEQEQNNGGGGGGGKLEVRHKTVCL